MKQDVLTECHAVLVQETSLGHASKFSWLSHLFSSDTLDRVCSGIRNICSRMLNYVPSPIVI